MDSIYLNLLPEPAQKMALAIEENTGREIVVRPRAEADLSLPGAEHLATLLTECAPGRHELAHAWLKSCGRTVSISAEETDIKAFNLANAISNEIEHLFVIPYEISLWPDALLYWQSDVQASLEHLEAESNENKVRGDGFLRLAIAEMALGNGDFSERIRTILHRYGFLEEAEHYLSALKATRGDVSAMMVVTAFFLVPNPRRYFLGQNDPQAGYLRYELDGPEAAHILRTLGLVR